MTVTDPSPFSYQADKFDKAPTTKEEEIRFQILNRLYRYNDFEKRRAAPYTSQNYNLTNITKLLAALGNPQEHFRVFHVAGTKGKGSTSYLLAYLLESMGYPTGHTLSPQLLDERDRFYLRGKKTSWDDILPIMDEVLRTVENIKLTPTVFDLFTAIAFLLFYRSGIEIAVVETGLGGRWDSTNCLESHSVIASLITLIDYDHTDKLGNTLPLIAAEKAGIIKPGIPLFTLNSDREVLEVLRSHTADKGSPFYILPPDPTSSTSTTKITTQAHPLIRDALKRNALNPHPHYLPPSTWANFNLAVECLSTLGYPLSKEVIEKTLGYLPLPGRYQKIDNLLLDGAHTIQSLRSLVASIQKNPELKSFDNVKVYFYCLYDKDIAGLVKEIPPSWELHFFDCKFHYVDPQKVSAVKKVVDETRGRKVPLVESLSHIPWRESPQTLHLFTGSFKLVGKILNTLYNLESNLKNNFEKQNNQGDPERDPNSPPAKHPEIVK